MKARIGSLGVILSAAAISMAAHAGEISPIFGGASVTPLTTAQNKAVVGKGYYANFYGSYGINFANYASLYGQYGDYASAATYADYAYQYFSVAYSYQVQGY